MSGTPASSPHEPGLFTAAVAPAAGGIVPASVDLERLGDNYKVTIDGTTYTTDAIAVVTPQQTIRVVDRPAGRCILLYDDALPADATAVVVVEEPGAVLVLRLPDGDRICALPEVLRDRLVHLLQACKSPVFEFQVDPLNATSTKEGRKE